jgi:hypothetical protein
MKELSNFHFDETHSYRNIQCAFVSVFKFSLENIGLFCGTVFPCYDIVNNKIEKHVDGISVLGFDDRCGLDADFDVLRHLKYGKYPYKSIWIIEWNQNCNGEVLVYKLYRNKYDEFIEFLENNL